MILSTVTDEVLENAALAEVFRAARKSGIRHFELRGAGGRRFPDFEGETLAALAEARKAGFADFTAASPGLFKLTLRDAGLAEHRGERLTSSLALCEALGVGRMVVFGLKRHPADRPGDFDAALQVLGEAAHAAGRRGITVLLENEPGYWGDTADNCRRLIEGVGSRSFRLNWDPGNAYNAGEGWRVWRPLLPYIENVHAKDVGQTGGFCAAGDGAVGWADILAWLAASGYRGHVAVETHAQPLYETFARSAAFLREQMMKIGGMGRKREKDE